MILTIIIIRILIIIIHRVQMVGAYVVLVIRFLQNYFFANHQSMSYNESFSWLISESHSYSIYLGMLSLLVLFSLFSGMLLTIYLYLYDSFFLSFFLLIHHHLFSCSLFIYTYIHTYIYTYSAVVPRCRIFTPQWPLSICGDKELALDAPRNAEAMGLCSGRRHLLPSQTNCSEGVVSCHSLFLPVPLRSLFHLLCCLPLLCPRSAPLHFP